MENTKPNNPLAKIELKPDYIKPFENIALAFSGGGFRAASFALGVLSYLNKVKFDEDDELAGQTLLQQVTFMSSASGGTIATTLYALHDAQGYRFGRFYSKLYTALGSDKLLKAALKNLAGNDCWKDTPAKSRNIINAFALAYNEHLFEGSTMEGLYPHDAPRAHLQEVCFNATEFYTGQSFRQDIKTATDYGTDPTFRYGNNDIFLDKKMADKIRLGDILAASSCFPAGFEPIVFPVDFTYNGGPSEAELKNALYMEPQAGDAAETQFIKDGLFGLMDGGITDNQGLQSLMDADERRLKGQTDFSPFNLMLVNDVGSHFIHPYELPKINKGWMLTLRGTFGIAGGLLLIFAALAALGIHIQSLPLIIAASVFAAMPVIYMAGLLIVKNSIFGASRSSSGVNLRRNFTEKIVSILLEYFTQTPLNIITQMLNTRAQSVLMLNTSIFLKRIRQILYDEFYGSPRWENRGKGNHVYDLAFFNNLNRAKSPEPASLAPSRDMQIVAQVAFNMGTTLWFDKQSTAQQHCEACLIACGQFTTSYNLLLYINRLLAKSDAGLYDARYNNRLQKLKQQLQADYDQFKTDPFFLYNKYGKDFKITDFAELTVKDIPCPEGW